MNLLRRKRHSHSAASGTPSSTAATQSLDAVVTPPRPSVSPTLTTPEGILTTPEGILSTPTGSPCKTLPSYIFEGYLNKKQDGNIRNWKRRYVVLTESKLIYFASPQEARSGDAGKCLDLQFCTVKIGGERHARSQSPLLSATSTPMPITPPPCAPSMSCDVLSSSLGVSNSKSSRRRLLTLSSSTENSPRRSCKSTEVHRSASVIEDREHRPRPASSCTTTVLLSPSLSTSKRHSTSSSSRTLEDFPSPVSDESEMTPQPRRRSYTLSSMKSSPSGVSTRERKGRAETPKSPTTSRHFKLVSLTGKTWAFEALSKTEHEEWIQAITQQIQASLEASFSDKKKKTPIEVVERIRRVPGNDICADCTQEDPEWASLNFGSLICINCSAVHRNLGTHVSRVRSLNLDEWSPALVKVMEALGNYTLLSIYEGRLEQCDLTRLPASASREEREKFISRKYNGKDFLADLPRCCDTKPLSLCLVDAVTSGNAELTFHILAHCCKTDLRERNSDGSTLLHISSAANDCVVTQLLIWAGVDMKARNAFGKTPVEVAAADCVELFAP